MDTYILKTESLNMTEKEFFNFCMDNPDLRMERNANKDIIIMSPTKYNTSKFNSKLTQLVANWNDAHEAGDVLDSNGGFTLPNGAVYSPDVSWVSKQTLAEMPEEETEMFAHICPDFVIELKSKSDSLKQLKLKMEEYIENGCRLGFLINPEEEKTYIYKPERDVIEKSFTEKVSGEDVLNGFELDCSFMITKK